MSKSVYVGFRATPEQQAKLSTLAKRLQLTHSEVLRVLLDSAEIAPLQVALPVAGVQQAEAVQA